MALLDDRAHLPPKAEAEDWLAAFETALQAGDAAAGLFLADSSGATSRFHLDDPDHRRPPADRGHAA